MARLVGVDLPRDKRIEIALTYIYGIGKTHAKETLAATGVSPDLRVRDLGDEDLLKLRDYIDEHFRVEGDLRREVAADIRRKVEIGCYQGLRHRRGRRPPGLGLGTGYFLTFFLPATVFLGPLRVRALVWVRWPRTGSPRRCRIPW